MLKYTNAKHFNLYCDVHYQWQNITLSNLLGTPKRKCLSRVCLSAFNILCTFIKCRNHHIIILETGYKKRDCHTRSELMIPQSTHSHCVSYV